MTSFQPVGELSRRNQVIDYLASVDYNQIVPYDTLETLLGVARRVVQAAVNQAKPGLEKEHRRTVTFVRGIGYRVAQPNEHIALAAVHQQKATRSLKRSLSKVKNVDAAQLTEGERTAVGLALTGIGLQLDYARRNDIRAKRHEEMIAATQQQSDRTEQEVRELKERLARLEAQTDGSTT